jgi:AraC-like DNA-binding protein
MIPAIQTAEMLLRGGTAGVLLALAAGLLREPRVPARLTGALFCLGAAGHALAQSPAIASSLGPAIAPAWVFAVMAGGLFWAFALELFGDSGPLGARRFAPALALLVISLAAAATPPAIARLLWLAQNLVNAGLMLHVLVVVWGGLRDDLVEPRRRLRGPMIAAVAVYALAISGVQATELFSRPASQLSILAAALLLALSLAGSLVFLKADERIFGAASLAAPAGRPRPIPAQDQPALARLRRVLDEEEAWRREDLTIGGLAQLVGVPEHRLRKIINEGLGHRNFAAFLNAHRVEAAKAALANPEMARRPVSAIAFDVGFSSLAPFNRAFRDAAGLTPTAWRQRALGVSSISDDPPQN